MTGTEMEATAKAALKVHNRAIEHNINSTLGRIAFGLDLIEIETNSLWLPLGFESFAAYCAAPFSVGGQGLQSRSRQTTMQVGNTFILKCGLNVQDLAEIPFSNLVTIASVATKDNIKILLSEAKVLANRDLKKNKLEGKYGEDGDKKTPIVPDDLPTVKRSFPCPHCEEMIALVMTGWREGATLDIEDLGVLYRQKIGEGSMTKGKSAKVKGTRVERDFVNKAKEVGLYARRVPGSGAFAGMPGDIIIEGMRCECKARKNGWQTMQKWIRGNDVLLLKPDREPEMVVMWWTDWLQLVLRATQLDMMLAEQSKEPSTSPSQTPTDTSKTNSSTPSE